MMSMMGRRRRVFLVEGLTLASVLVFLTSGISLAQTKTIIDEWATVQAPKPPELKPVTLDPKITALLVLDFVKQTCNTERRPRCLDSVPKVQTLLKQARAKGVTVIHSTTTAATPADIAKELTPLEGEPIVKASADKFFKTDLEKILSEKGIKTVVVVGTAAQGAVLNTASQAAFRGLQVIIPVDGMSAENTYFEQYTIYHLANAPGVGQQVTLTKIDMIK
ncbi:MAG TPA: cysteine hydrolase [Candidatus Acidoferrales bacterium]|nr:cysteine hydrolase [Candidatus Acidoferrales bacterium]